MEKKVYIKQDECIGCELCTQISCKVFRMNDQKAEVVPDGEDAEDKIQEAIDSCPAQCIVWR